MIYVSETMREQVRQRAGNRWEYCLSHQDYVMGRLQVDHVWPVAKDGADTENNLCLACELCNQYKWKWACTHGDDPLTNLLVELFNPRQEEWREHFIWSEAGVQMTPQGRTTVAVLRMNNTLATAVRKNCWHPPQTT